MLKDKIIAIILVKIYVTLHDIISKKFAKRIYQVFEIKS